jgi:hypothetical protein
MIGLFDLGRGRVGRKNAVLTLKLLLARKCDERLKDSKAHFILRVT